MNTSDIVEQIDSEIERLERVKALLTGEAVQARRGRPAGSGNKKTMSPATRDKIAAAQRRSWAKGRKKK